MFGLEILDIAIGLAFVYLLLSLMCTAINEYVASMLNKRGKELFRGINQILGDDKDLRDAFYKHPLISSLYRPGEREPSYIPARNFAMALLSVTDYTRRKLGGKAVTTGEDIATPKTPGKAVATGGDIPTPETLEQALDTLRTDSAADVSELLLAPEMAPVLANAALPDAVRQKLVGLAVGSESELNKLHDSVEVWFNNAMDRVSGSYKRYTQISLFVIGLVLAFVVNADTIQIWRTLAVDDELREAMVHRAAALVDSIDARLVHADTGSAPAADPQAAGSSANDSAAVGAAGDTAAVDPAAARETASRPAIIAQGLARPAGAPNTVRAEQLYREARAELDQSSLNLGWSWAEAGRLGVARSETPADPRGPWDFQSPFAWHWSAVLSKLLGLLITGIALSLGAPFWFDTLNRFINIRGAGRAPDEKPRSPEVPGKRAAERATK